MGRGIAYMDQGVSWEFFLYFYCLKMFSIVGSFMKWNLAAFLVRAGRHFRYLDPGSADSSCLAGATPKLWKYFFCFFNIQGVHTVPGHLNTLFLNGLRYQYYTSTKQYCHGLMSDGNVSPHFEKWLKGRQNLNVFNSNPYIVAHLWKALLTRKIMTLRRGFYDIPYCQNGGLSKVTSWLTLIGHHLARDVINK